MRLLYVSHGYSTHDHRFLTAFCRAGLTVQHLAVTAQRLDPRPAPDGCISISLEGAGSTMEARAEGLRRLAGEFGPDVTLAGPVQSGAKLVADAG